jgi:dipeptidyl aminopeptidase/acylaminoacyl peptidase
LQILIHSSSDRLAKTWGIVDTDDCVDAVKALAQQGLIDISRVAIRGGSSGGYTTLRGVTVHPDFFTAATSCYGISELIALERETHKVRNQNQRLSY